MKVARINGRTPYAGSLTGLGGMTPIPRLDDLPDVDAATPVDGDSLVWSDVDNAWVPGASGTEGWSNVKACGAAGDGVTDDTAAIRACIDSATASGTQSATIYFPPGTYLIGGALQDTGAFNAQIPLPTVAIGTSTPQIVIKFMGAARPPFAVVPTQNEPAPAGYSVLRSTLTGGTGTAAVFSAGNVGYNNISVFVEKLICLSPSNPSLTFWNLQNSQGGGFQDVMVWTDDWLGGVVPTHSNSYGVKMPGKGQSNYTYVVGLSVRNYYTGIRYGELCFAKGLQVSVCIVGIELPAADFPSVIEQVYFNGVPYALRATGGISPVDILDYSHEHYPSDPDWATIYDLDDPSDYLYGSIRWWNVEWSVGADHIFDVNGGANTSNAEVGPLTSGGGTPATTVTDETTYGITPAVGTDLEYARQDHTHGSPPTPSAGAAHYLVIASSHSTPLVFGDLVQTSAGDDLIYTT